MQLQLPLQTGQACSKCFSLIIGYLQIMLYIISIIKKRPKAMIKTNICLKDSVSRNSSKVMVKHTNSKQDSSYLSRTMAIVKSIDFLYSPRKQQPSKHSLSKVKIISIHSWISTFLYLKNIKLKITKSCTPIISASTVIV